MSDVTWLPEGGHYEQQSGQGEDPWADAAEFDIISCPAEDTQTTATGVSWDNLTAAASSMVAPFEKPNR